MKAVTAVPQAELDALMADFLDTHSYVGPIQPWRETPETDDDPDDDDEHTARARGLYREDQSRDDHGRFEDEGADRVRTEALFARLPSLAPYRGIPIVRADVAPTGSRHQEAEVKAGKIYLYAKFDALSPEAQDYVLAHEIGHAVLDEFGLPAMIKEAAALDIDVWNDLPFAQHNMHEAFADAFASHHTAEGELATRYPKWLALVKKIAASKATPRALYREDQERDEIGRFEDEGGAPPPSHKELEEAGQAALFDYAPESGSEQALRRDARHGIAHVERLVEAAIDDADYTNEAADWDDLDSDDQQKVFETWEQTQYEKNYVQEAGFGAIDSYIGDTLSTDAITRQIAEDGDFAKAFTDATGTTIDEDTLDWRFVDESIGSLVTDKEGNPLTAEQRETANTLYREHFERTRDSMETDLRESDEASEAQNEAEREAISAEWDDMGSDTRLAMAIEQGHASSVELRPGAPSVWKWDSDDQSDEDYVRTHAIARELAKDRTAALLAERGLIPDAGDADGMATDVAAKFWSEWKNDSQAPLGLAMQLAVSKEMGTLPTPLSFDRQQQAERAAIDAFTTYSERDLYHRPDDPDAMQTLHDLAWGRAQAYVRAQWETSQFLLERAGTERVDLYRGLILPVDDLDRVTNETVPLSDVHRERTFTRLPNLALKQNAVASTTTKESVANSWNGVGVPYRAGKTDRVVLRFSAPREAVFSLPVFGDNVEEESEVVLMGTKGIQWDAWRGTAPTTTVAPITLRRQRTAAAAGGKKTTLVVDMLTNQPKHWLKGWRKTKDVKRPPLPTMPPARREESRKTIDKKLKGAQVRALYREDQLRDDQGQFAYEGGGAPGAEAGGPRGEHESGQTDGGGGKTPGTIETDPSGEVTAYIKADGATATFVEEEFNPEKSATVLSMTENEVKLLAGHLVQHLTGDLIVTVQTNKYEDSITIRARSPNGHTSMVRSFERLEDGALVAHHEFFKLPADAQGHGVAKAVMRDTLGAYAAAGVDSVELEANLNVGSYAWARYGFVATEPSNLAAQLVDTQEKLMDDLVYEQVPSRVESLPGLSERERARITDLILTHQHDPELPWVVAGLHIGNRHVGKELLTMPRVYWHANLNLKNPTQMDRFHRYVSPVAPTGAAWRGLYREDQLRDPDGKFADEGGAPAGSEAGFADFRPHRTGEEEDPDEWDRAHGMGAPAPVTPKTETKTPGTIEKDPAGDVRAYVKADGKTAAFRDKNFDAKKSAQILGMDENQTKELAAIMVTHLPGDLEVNVTTMLRSDKVRIEAFGGQNLYTNRSFMRDTDGKLVVHHDYFQIPTSMQGKGLAKQVMADQIAAYERAGVDRVELLANINQGGYAWARYGFVASNPQALASVLTTPTQWNASNQLEPDPVTKLKLSPEHERAVRTMIELHRDDPKLPWILAGLYSGDRHVGKELLNNEVGWEGVLHLKDPEQMWRFRRYIAPGPRGAEARALYREDQARDDHGRFEDEGGGAAPGSEAGGSRGEASQTDGGSAADPVILRGVDSHANVVPQVVKQLKRWWADTGDSPSPAALQAAETALRSLPLVHGTTVAGALGAATEGLRSYAEMQAQSASFLEDVNDLKSEIEDRWGSLGIDDDEDWMNWSADDIQQYTDLDRREAKELAGKLADLRDITAVLKGTTNAADRQVGLDQFVFMTHGSKHPDYGDVAVIIDNEVFNQPGSFATERDIVAIPGINDFEHGEVHYTADGVKRYQQTIVTGDGYYKVAAAAMGTASPNDLAYRTSDRLFELKTPRVPASAVKGFMVEDIDTAQRLADRLGQSGRIFIPYNDSTAGRAHTALQLRSMQTTGMWDTEALEAFREKHDGAGVYIL